MKKWSYLLSLLLSFSILNATIGEEDKPDKINDLIKESIIAIQNQDYEQALTFIRKAKSFELINTEKYGLPKKPDSKKAEIYQMEGQLLEMLGRRDEAITAWQNCLYNAESELLIKEAEVHLKHLRD